MVLSRNQDAGRGKRDAGSGTREAGRRTQEAGRGKRDAGRRKREKRGELILAAHPGLMVVLTTVVLRS